MMVKLGLREVRQLFQRVSLKTKFCVYLLRNKVIMQGYSKKIKRLLRKLNEESYTRELHSELSKLSTKFDSWKQGKLDCHELSDAIHKFQKPSRGLVNTLVVI